MSAQTARFSRLRAEPLVEIDLLGEARVGGEDHRAAQLLQIAGDVALVAREGAELRVDDVDLDLVGVAVDDAHHRVRGLLERRHDVLPGAAERRRELEVDLGEALRDRERGERP